MTRTAYEVQRDFALSSGLRSEIIWDSLAPDEGDVLKQKIASLLCENESQNSKALAKQRQLLFDNVWLQRKYTNRMLLSAIIYVLVTPETDPELALCSINYSCHPIFRTRKCMRGDNSEGCCMNFIDEHGRVYANWSKFVFANTLPRGTMIAPSQGVYTFGDGDTISLMLHPTPCSQIKHKILSAGDTVATVGGLVASVPVAAALAVPVAGPILIVATAAGAATVAYSTARSVARLFDRRRHGQPTSITDSDARSSWLGVAGGVVGLGATGATKALSTVAATGWNVNAAAQLAVKGINVSSIVISGTGVINGVYELYLKISDDQALSSYDVLQIASNLVIFTHSINNFRIASKVTNGSTLRSSLRTQARKVFDRISRETGKLQVSGGDTGQKFDFVRILNSIPFQDVLLSLHKINERLLQGASVVGALGASLLPNIVSTTSNGQLHVNLEAMASQFGCKFVQHIGNIGNFSDVLNALANYFSESATQFLIQMTRVFIEQKVDNIESSLHTFVSTETVLYRILMHCVTTYDDFTREFLEQRRQEIMGVTLSYFQSLQAVNTESCKKHKCPTCKGVFYICDL
ncbi:uncharacterized protein LOC115632825 [Scaptodrosophila lebanonensis]|uniref:Uncharacterized protein LOC115632825 n=1 Tax=Drosophila lebanonensis TaxID=7225 RepID=A0A6J2UFQ4_DROLE|nr:uncharacterized protein LOC115632825 [Scaptodrosophila lebanonensis]